MNGFLRYLYNRVSRRFGWHASLTSPSNDARTTQPKLYSLVPGAAPVELVSYYESFAWYYPESELQTKRWFVETVEPDWVVLDVGANVGIYSVLLGRLASRGHVHAFEPTATSALLRKNLSAAGLTNVTVHELALGRVTGNVEDAIYRMWGSEPERDVYRFSTLDDVVATAGLSRLDCIKIDVDGFDLEVLKGAEKTLARFDPWVIVEINHALATRGQSIDEAFSWLHAHGYRLAEILDSENYVVKRQRPMAARKIEGLLLAFDREPVLLPDAFVAGERHEGSFATTPALHNDARPEWATDRAPTIRFKCPRWSSIADWALARRDLVGPAVIEIEIEVLDCAVGLGCLEDNLRTYIGKEVTVHPGPGVQTVTLFVPDISAARCLMLRSHQTDPVFGTATIRSLQCATARPSDVSMPALMRSAVRRFDIDACLPTGGASVGLRLVDIVPVGQLGGAFGFELPYIPDIGLYHHGLDEFRTEIDEAGLFRYLYRNFKPGRHLEFGTRDGFGAVLCARSCAANIWSVDLPDETSDAEGKSVHSSRERTALEGDNAIGTADAPRRVGWRYRQAGLESRVRQLPLDGETFDDRGFADGFFDTVLINGGYTPGVVTDCTDKAIRLLRPGGLMIWHDFCPEPTILAKSEAGRGVVRAMVDHYDRWKPRFDRMFWVRPSWLFVGIKKR